MVFFMCCPRKLNESYINSLGVHYLPGWKDPWGERPMTFGEVGCFLSHYFIWQQVKCGFVMWLAGYSGA